MTDLNTGVVRRATVADLNEVADLLADAFHAGDLAPWLIPDTDERTRVYPGYFAIFAEHALTYGLVELIDGSATAVWYPFDASPRPAIPNYADRLAEAVGAGNLRRFRQLDEAMELHHPPGPPHDYLAFIAVRPDRQGLGLGGRLLDSHHQLIDRIGIPSYLEATGPRNEGLYARHGYRVRDRYRPAVDCPPIRSMWRDPQQPRSGMI
jgi:GNAT superfamily N-acetyltransferase